MANYNVLDLVQSAEVQDWFKCALALQITKTGVVNLVENEMARFHRDSLNNVLQTYGLPNGSTCNSCTTHSVVPCPTKGICIKRQHSGECSYHKGPQKICPTKICSGLAKAVVSEHKQKAPSWKNVDATKWCTSAWELAKGFLSPGGYLKATSARDTDFNGLISILQNCLRFQNLLSLKADGENGLLQKVGRAFKIYF